MQDYINEYKMGLTPQYCDPRPEAFAEHMPTASAHCLDCFQRELWKLGVPFVAAPAQLLTLAEFEAIPVDSVNQPTVCYWCKGKTFEIIYYC